MKRKASRLALAIGTVEDGDIIPVAYIAAETKQDEDICMDFRSDDLQFTILLMVDMIPMVTSGA